MLHVLARIALSMMVMLPHLLYHFANLSVNVPTALFRQLDSLLRDLVWDGGRRSIALVTLRCPTRGGAESLRF